MHKKNKPDNPLILLVDNDLVLQRLLQNYLQSHHYIVHALSGGDEIEAFLRTCKPDMVLLDILLPGKDGMFWLEQLKENQPALPVLILSAKQSNADRIRCLELGADDCLSKPFHNKELLLRIRNILRHRTPPQEQLEKESHAFYPERGLFTKDELTIKLTPTENKILKFFFDHMEKLVTRDQLSEALYGSSYNPLDRTIDVHINRLRKKIEDNPGTPKYLHTIWGKGYRFSSETTWWQTHRKAK